MELEYSEVFDPAYQLVRETYTAPDHVLVRSKTYSNVPFCDHPKDQVPYFMMRRYQNVGQRIKDLQVRKDDVCIVSYPKSGTTWTAEMVWLICNGLNFELARAINLHERVRFLEYSLFHDECDSLMAVEKMPNPRFIRTHIPASLQPDMMWTVKPKIIYVYRNVKSVAVSFFHHHRTLATYHGTLEQYVRLFTSSLISFSPYHQHVLEFNALNHLDNILLVSYEDMKKDLKAVIFRVCSFLRKKYSEEQVEKLCQHLSFESMKNNPSINKWMMRKGQADGWKHELSEELVKLIDEWTRDKVASEDDLQLFL